MIITITASGAEAVVTISIVRESRRLHGGGDDITTRIDTFSEKLGHGCSQKHAHAHAHATLSKQQAASSKQQNIEMQCKVMDGWMRMALTAGIHSEVAVAVFAPVLAVAAASTDAIANCNHHTCKRGAQPTTSKQQPTERSSYLVRLGGR